jgi:alkanesulfonate monooxygenase SsuD/methylene tetrahydromethanopterin reductase-like flavin-dependent oxidoreductase (luciferase family)
MPRIGLVIRPEWPPERLRGYAAAVEAAGLDDVWLWEDCFFSGGVAAASAALAATSSVRVGLGLMPAPLRNPVLAAMEISGLARLFPGRFVPAAGHGVLPWMVQVGAAVASPMGLLREWVPAVRALLRGETVTVSGEYVRLDQVTLDWPPAEVPPLLVGARGPKTLALAGELADGLCLDASFTAAGVAQAIAQSVAAQSVAAQPAATRPAEVVVYLPTGSAPGSAERILAQLRSPAEPLAERTALGTPAEVAAAIRAYADAGATTVALQPTPDDPDIEGTLALAAAAREHLRTEHLRTGD